MRFFITVAAASLLLSGTLAAPLKGTGLAQELQLPDQGDSLVTHHAHQARAALLTPARKISASTTEKTDEHSLWRRAGVSETHVRSAHGEAALAHNAAAGRHMQLQANYPANHPNHAGHQAWITYHAGQATHHATAQNGALPANLSMKEQFDAVENSKKEANQSGK